jgi:NAD(P)-dependent dehydrogenase (short-subunit alcohol dehydrogenase family)
MTRTSVITGVSGGIGSATAAAFKREGWEVLGMDLRAVTGMELDDFRKVDMADADAVKDALDSFAERGIDVLVNNAAINRRITLNGDGPADWDEVVNINLRASFLTTRIAARAMETRGGGAIVNVSSVHALATTAGSSAYAATKAGLVGFTRAAAVELAPARIRVNAVLPGAIDTPMLRGDGSGGDRIALIKERTPLGRLGRPDEIAEAIVFLADPDRASFITGQILIVDGGAMARLSTE